MKKPWWELLWSQCEANKLQWDLVRASVDHLCDLISFTPGDEVLDIACGRGTELIELVARGAVGTGLDFSESMLAVARQDAEHRSVKVNWICADMRTIDWRHAFDIIMVRDVIFGIFDRPTNIDVISRLARALKPGGRLFFQVYHKDWAVKHGIEGFLAYTAKKNLFEGRLKKIICGQKRELKVTMDLMTIEEWKNVLESMRLEDISVSDRHDEAQPENSAIIEIVGRLPMDGGLENL